MLYTQHIYNNKDSIMQPKSNQIQIGRFNSMRKICLGAERGKYNHTILTKTNWMCVYSTNGFKERWTKMNE